MRHVVPSNMCRRGGGALAGCRLSGPLAVASPHLILQYIILYYTILYDIIFAMAGSHGRCCLARDFAAVTASWCRWLNYYYYCYYYHYYYYYYQYIIAIIMIIVIIYISWFEFPPGRQDKSYRWRFCRERVTLADRQPAARASDEQNEQTWHWYYCQPT